MRAGIAFDASRQEGDAGDVRPIACSTCPARRGEWIERGPLTITSSPLVAYWHGLPLRLAQGEVAILLALARTGEASHLALQVGCTGPDAHVKVIGVRLSQMRRKLPRQILIEAVRGQGYRLVIRE